MTTRFFRKTSIPKPVVIERKRLDPRGYRMTPALEKAGYKVPESILLREGFGHRIDRPTYPR